MARPAAAYHLGGWSLNGQHRADQVDLKDGLPVGFCLFEQ
jgi:hypothetical protein